MREHEIVYEGMRGPQWGEVVCSCGAYISVCLQLQQTNGSQFAAHIQEALAVAPEKATT